MTEELYEIEKQTKDLNVKNLSQSQDIAQDNKGDTIRTNSVPDPEFIIFVVLISAALLFVASIYYGIINP